MAQAKRGDVVKVQYTARLEDGTVFDTSMNRHPLRFTIGDGQVIPGFDQAVIGMHPGETKTAHIPMDKAYGSYQEDMVVTLARSQLPENLELEVAQTLEITFSDRGRATVTVADISEGKVTLDANHPLAGKDLVLDIELIEIV
jgi:peptidylprolyl isomerase